MMNTGKQAVTGVVPPQTREALIREVWPSVAAFPGPAALAQKLMRSLIGAPLAWMMMVPLYMYKVVPLGRLAIRYTLTNRRVMIRRGMRPEASQQVALADIDDVRLLRDANSEFFRSGTL